MATIPHPATCQSCAYYVSTAEAYGEGVCSNENSPAAFEYVTLRSSCCEHDSQQFGDLAGHVLYERQCVSCERVNLYAMGYGGDAWCAFPDCPTNR